MKKDGLDKYHGLMAIYIKIQNNEMIKTHKMFVFYLTFLGVKNVVESSTVS